MATMARLCLVCTLVILAGCAAQKDVNDAGDLTILTENYAPFSYLEGGKVTGLSTEVVREIMKRTGAGNEIKLVPWEKGYEAVLAKPNVALFSMAMTPERRNLVQWVGPIACQDAKFYARRESGIRIAHLEDAKKVGKIATVTDYYTEQTLKREKFANLESCANEGVALKKLLNGEVELFPSSSAVMPALLKANGVTMDAVDPVFTISTDLIYIAFSKGTSPALVAQWQEKVDAMKRDGTLRRIYATWLPGEAAPEVLQLVTEEYPPVTFMKDRKVTGFVTEMVREILARRNIPDNIRLTAWKNAYTLALTNPNVVLFSAERTKERENFFQWVGPVGKNTAFFYAKKGSGVKVGSLEDARKVPAIATTTNWFTEQNLKSKGFTNLVSSPLPETGVKQLMDGKVQLAVFTDITVADIVKRAGYSMTDLEPIVALSSTEFYIAMSLGTPREEVDKWQSALDALKRDGTFEKIYRSFVPNADMKGLLRR